jgi:energy-coupling factor transporter ATP-binding protein EcfA2
MTTHLVGLRAENYKRLTLVDVEFEPGGGAVAIMGRNEAGKSSLLDALETALAGRRGPKATEPIHQGADTARVIATFDDLIVTRTFTTKGTQITVAGRDGRRYANAEDLLKDLYSHIALDPLAFARLTDKEQVDALLGLIGFDPTELDAEFKQLFDERTDLNRGLKGLRAQHDAIPAEPGTRREEVSAAALLAEVDRIEQHNRNILNLANRLESARADVRDALEVMEAAKARLRTAEGNATAAKAAYDAAPEIEDPAPLRAQIADLDRVNAAIRKQQDRDDLAKAIAVHEGTIDALEERMTAIRAEKREKLAAAKLPLPDLTITDDGVLLRAGTPFSQASTAAKAVTGTAIGMALNPNLRLIVIRDASLLDTENRETIDRLARENGFLVLMEIADTNAPVGIVIEDGTVAEVRTAETVSA